MLEVGDRMALPIDPGSLVDQFGIPAGIEWIVILIVLAVLFLLGPKKIPELARSIGRAMGEFRRGRAELEREINREAAMAPTEPGASRVATAAKRLGVDTGGRQEMELRLEIARKIDTASDEAVTDVARSLGVYESGETPTRQKERIIKSLGV